MRREEAFKREKRAILKREGKKVLIFLAVLGIFIGVSMIGEVPEEEEV